MVEMWNILSKLNPNEEKTTLQNLIKFICALEGVATNKIIRKKVNYTPELF